MNNSNSEQLQHCRLKESKSLVPLIILQHDSSFNVSLALKWLFEMENTLSEQSAMFT